MEALSKQEYINALYRESLIRMTKKHKKHKWTNQYSFQSHKRRFRAEKDKKRKIVNYKPLHLEFLT